MALDKSEVDVLCTRIADMFNPEEIIDILGVDSEELVEELRGLIADNRDKFYVYMEES